MTDPLSALLDGIREEMRKEPEAHVLAVQIELTSGSDQMATLVYFRGSFASADAVYDMACFRNDVEREAKRGK